MSGEGVRVTTFAEPREAPSREEPNEWDELHEWREKTRKQKSADAAAADVLVSAIRERTTAATISAAFAGKRSLGEIDAAKLLGVRLQDIDVLGRGGGSAVIEDASLRRPCAA